MYRVLKIGGFSVSSYGWNRVGLFQDARRKDGLRVVGHQVFQKPQSSSQRFLRHTHQQADLVAKGSPFETDCPVADILPSDKTGNRQHPAQKPLPPLDLIIWSLIHSGDLVLDAFCGSGSTLAAAPHCARHFLGLELEGHHHMTASACSCRAP